MNEHQRCISGVAWTWARSENLCCRGVPGALPGAKALPLPS
jgi:hypothetical protein